MIHYLSKKFQFNTIIIWKKVVSSAYRCSDALKVFKGECLRIFLVFHLKDVSLNKMVFSAQRCSDVLKVFKREHLTVFLAVNFMDFVPLPFYNI